MSGIDRLYSFAEKENIFVYFGKIGFSSALTVRDAGDYNIMMDPGRIHTSGEEKLILMHELSHIATDSFYKNGHDIQYRRKMENRATNWLIKFLIPEDELIFAVQNGFTEVWDLADYFEVPEDFMLKAIAFYQQAIA